jgi:hypothetical protein
MAEKEFNEEWVTDSEAAYAFYRANPDRAALAIAKIIANESKYYKRGMTKQWHAAVAALAAAGWQLD